jgi:hypothetical protein
VEWDDLGGPWLVARAYVTDRPSWLKRGTKASFGFKAPGRSSFIDGWVYNGYVTEVTVCSPSHEPKEPLAEVVLLERTSPAARPTRSTAAGSDRLAAGEVFYGGGLIRRPSIGRVLGVR